MGKHERRAYLEAIRDRYLMKADRAGNARILDEFWPCVVICRSSDVI